MSGNGGNNMSRGVIDLGLSNTDVEPIVLMIKQTKKSDIYELYCNELDEEHNLGIACIQNLRTSKLIRKLFDSAEETGNIYMNCKYNDTFKKYEPVSKADTDTLAQLKNLF